MTSLLLARYYCWCRRLKVSYLGNNERVNFISRGDGTGMLKLKSCLSCRKRVSVGEGGDTHGMVEVQKLSSM